MKASRGLYSAKFAVQSSQCNVCSESCSAKFVLYMEHWCGAARDVAVHVWPQHGLTQAPDCGAAGRQAMDALEEADIGVETCMGMVAALRMVSASLDGHFVWWKRVGLPASARYLSNRPGLRSRAIAACAAADDGPCAGSVPPLAAFLLALQCGHTAAPSVRSGSAAYTCSAVCCCFGAGGGAAAHLPGQGTQLGVGGGFRCCIQCGPEHLGHRPSRAGAAAPGEAFKCSPAARGRAPRLASLVTCPAMPGGDAYGHRKGRAGQDKAVHGAAAFAAAALGFSLGVARPLLLY